MIVLPSIAHLSGIERFGLDRLVDLSRLVPAPLGIGDGLVRLEIAGESPPRLDPATCIARDWYLHRGEGVITVPRPVLGVIGAIAAGVAEQQSPEKDRHGRVPAGENRLVQSGLERHPVVSQAARTLREAAIAVAGPRPVRFVTPWPEGRRWAAALTHDLDLVRLWPAAVLSRLAELARKGRLGIAASAAARALLSVGRNPVWRGVQAVLDPEAQLYVRSTWFIICETPTLASMLAGDVTYRPESPAAHRILRDLGARGCEIALHGSFVTAEQEGALELQRERLAAISSTAPIGVRQHFLRMRPAETPGWMRDAGFQYDSTWGFHDRNGFRLGVADVLPLWDAAADREVTLEEAPFCWMDRALSKYRGIESPGAWVDDGLALAAECEAVDGLWVGVWHPNMHPGLGFPGATASFERLVGDLAARRPFFGSLSTMVRWRTGRRGISAVGIQPDGTVDAVASTSGGYPFLLESAKGRPMEKVRVALP